jgi:hypothetical protein
MFISEKEEGKKKEKRIIPFSFSRGLVPKFLNAVVKGLWCARSVCA